MWNVTFADAGPGDEGQDVVEVQYILRSYGYSLPVDGEYGPKTTKAVKHFQQANGLQVDGIAGPITMEALRGAKRISIPTTVNSNGLRGMPFAPSGLSDCDEMRFYLEQAGLPPQFNYIGYRESRCQNDVGNYCCHGYFGLHAGNIENHWSYEPFIKRHCLVFGVSDYKGLSPLQKQKSACFAAVLYDISGMTPWRL